MGIERGYGEARLVDTPIEYRFMKATHCSQNGILGDQAGNIFQGNMAGNAWTLFHYGVVKMACVAAVGKFHRSQFDLEEGEYIVIADWAKNIYFEDSEFCNEYHLLDLRFQVSNPLCASALIGGTSSAAAGAAADASDGRPWRESWTPAAARRASSSASASRSDSVR